MSLLQKASIITTPTAYAEDYLYSIKPAYALGSELITNGTFDTDSDWSKGSGWTISGGKANRSGESGNSFISQDINVIAGRNYIVKYDRTYVSGDGQTNLFSYFEGNSSRTTRGNYEDTTVETVTVTDYFKPTYTGNLSLRIYGISDFTGSVDNVSIKEITDADFDFDRNSTGTRVNEDYLIEDVPYNFVTHSQNLSQWLIGSGMTVTTNQIIAPDSTLSADKIEKTSQNYTYVRQSLSTGFISVFSVFVKKGNYRYVGIRNNDSGHSVFDFETKSFVTSKADHNLSFEESGNGWFRLIDKRTISTNTSAFRGVALTLANGTELHSDIPLNAFAYIWGGQFVKGDQPKDYLKTTDRLDIPRIDYTNGEPSILLEPSRTNSYQYSNDITQSFWFNLGVLIDTSNLYLSPEGINNAQKITADSGSYRLLRPTTGISGSGYTQSIFVKNINALNFYLRTASGFSYYNFETKTINLAFSGDNLTAIHYPNDWVRLITTTPNASYKQFGFGQNETDFNEIGRSAYIYGAQLEAGSYATSLIHTSGSAVTRSADAANNAGNSDLINSTEGVLYAEFSYLDTGYISLNDGTNTNRLFLGFGGVQVYTQVRVNLSVVADMAYGSYPKNEVVKAAIKYKANDFALWVNGVEVVVDSSGNTFPTNTLNQLSFNNGSSNPFYGNTKSVMVFKEALTDLELEKLTGYNNHELYMNYYNRLSYLGLAEEYNVESDINNYIL